MRYFPGKLWYALRVRYQHDDIVEKSLSNKDFSPLRLTYQEVSRRRGRKRVLVKAFFPGYMFINASLDAHRHVDVLTCPGVIEILKNSSGPIPIPEEQIANVLKLRKYEGEILTFQNYARGMAVRIVRGPLSGIVGKIDELMRGFIKISVDSIPGSVAIQVDRSLIEPLDADLSLSSCLGA